MTKQRQRRAIRFGIRLHRPKKFSQTVNSVTLRSLFFRMLKKEEESNEEKTSLHLCRTDAVFCIGVSGKLPFAV
jgi:hypothetical protein